MKDFDPRDESQDLQSKENLRLREKLLAYEKENTKLLQKWGTRIAERLCAAVGAKVLRDK